MPEPRVRGFNCVSPHSLSVHPSSRSCGTIITFLRVLPLSDQRRYLPSPSDIDYSLLALHDRSVTSVLALGEVDTNKLTSVPYPPPTQLLVVIVTQARMKAILTILLAFQNCTTLMTCLPKQIGNVRAPTTIGQVAVLTSVAILSNNFGLIDEMLDERIRSGMVLDESTGVVQNAARYRQTKKVSLAKQKTKRVR